MKKMFGGQTMTQQKDSRLREKMYWAKRSAKQPTGYCYNPSDAYAATSKVVPTAAPAPTMNISGGDQ